MKVIQILGHPITLMMTFLIVLISGEAFGGPYIVYLVLGLPHGADYALAGAAGVACLFAATVWPPEKYNFYRQILIFAGIVFMLLSLYFFFAHDGMRYNYATFMQTVPVITIIVFGISVLSGLLVCAGQLLVKRYAAGGH